MNSKKTAVIRHIGKRGRGKGQFMNPCGITVTLTGIGNLASPIIFKIEVFSLLLIKLLSNFCCSDVQPLLIPQTF